MRTPPSSDYNESYRADSLLDTEDTYSAVSWPAIIGGAFVVVAFSLVLIALGAGMGFASASPWPHEGISAVHFTSLAAIWLIIVQWVSSGLGGYLTGRLRTKWIGVHTHEVFFRDTAHGFITWAVATVVSALILLFAASSSLSGNNHMIGATSMVQSKSQDSTMYEAYSAGTFSYYVDSLLRGDHSGASVDQAAKTEVAHILEKGLKDDSLSDADKSYLAQLISVHTGLSAPDAEKKIDDMMAHVRQSADEMRKTAASVSIYTFLSMLIGAFIASAAAAFGGQQRDKPYPHSI